MTEQACCHSELSLRSTSRRFLTRPLVLKDTWDEGIPEPAAGCPELVPDIFS